ESTRRATPSAPRVSSSGWGATTSSRSCAPTSSSRGASSAAAHPLASASATQQSARRGACVIATLLGSTPERPTEVADHRGGGAPCLGERAVRRALDVAPRAAGGDREPPERARGLAPPRLENGELLPRLGAQGS